MGVAKVLIVGSINGQLSKAFEKISKLHAKQNFSFACVIGNIFGQTSEADTELESLLNGSIHAPLPIYFTVGDNSFPGSITQKLESSDEVCNNLIYLGRKGTFTTSDGVRIVFLGGKVVVNDTASATALSKFDPLFTDADARSLHGARSAHILLTNQWPANIHRLSSFELPAEIDKDAGSQAVAKLCLALKPWYHYSNSPAAAWEREPFRQPNDYGSLEASQITRFKGIASINTSNKEWMSAFTIKTEEPPSAQQSTEVPFLSGSPPRKRPAPDQHDGSFSRYSDYGQGRRPNKRPRQQDQSECFMCLNKPNFKTHMVVSIGEESMVTILRGPLPLANTFPQLSSSGHVMIIPHYHAADEMSQGKRSADEVSAEFNEMSKFRKALSAMVGTKSNGSLGTVCWEVNRTGIRHFHWQLIAAKVDQIRKGLVEGAFKLSAQNNKLASFTLCEPDQQLEQRSDYFRLWTWTPLENPVERANSESNGESDHGVTKSMYMVLPASEKNFNIWFGREVMAGLMQLENRVNWKAALHPDAEEETKLEEADAAGLKEDFVEFDFAMQ